MRFFALLLLAAVLLAPFASHAASSGSQYSFGSITCPQRVACPDSGAPLPASEYVASADACVTQNFGPSADGSSFFNDSMAPDSNGCLNTKPVAGVGGKTPILPHCCLMKLKDDQCAFNCDLVR